ncbi:MAG: DEAD/DEAH box helicase, partial [Casimicrobiaceae bacterium]
MIARIAVCGAVTPPFDYWVPAGLSLARGAVVRVAVNRRACVGVVVAMDDTPAVANDKLHALEEVVDLPLIPGELLDVATFVAGYYHEPLGAVLANVVPPLKSSRTTQAASAADPPAQGFELNAAQRAAVESIAAGSGTFGVSLLQGVTGSGKTAVYLAAAERAIAAGGQVLILVPEINLTPQFEQQVR